MAWTDVKYCVKVLIGTLNDVFYIRYIDSVAEPGGGL